MSRRQRRTGRRRAPKAPSPPKPPVVAAPQERDAVIAIIDDRLLPILAAAWTAKLAMEHDRTEPYVGITLQEHVCLPLRAAIDALAAAVRKVRR